MIPKNLHDAAMGGFLGALVGDAAGATLEFLGRKPTPEDVTWAMGMPGGGVWNVAPGQITDDGELTLCLAQGLAVKEPFDLEAIACNYTRWIDSNPFDIGNTTAYSLGAYRESQWQNLLTRRGYAGVMRQAASDRCIASKANGSLMRISPLGIWGHRFDDEKLADFARQDARLSHPNPSCGDAAACYTIAMASLMRKPGDREAAFTAAKTWLTSQTAPNLPQNSEAVSGASEVLQWLQDAQNNLSVPYR
ncbi:ADP-ribosylglycohydrolase family protein, partial [Oscillatoriales cyanobacterium LEGE 11467]